MEGIQNKLIKGIPGKMVKGSVLPGTNETRFYLNISGEVSNYEKKKKENVFRFEAITKRWKHALHSCGLKDMDR